MTTEQIAVLALRQTPVLLTEQIVTEINSINVQNESSTNQYQLNLAII